MASSPPSYLSLPTSSNVAAAFHRRPSLSFLFAPLRQKPPLPSHPSTNKVILHYLLHLSIQSRLKQADLELNELRTSATSITDEAAEERQRLRIETASRAEKDKNAVEAIVSGILSNHRIRTLGVRLDLDLKHRLYLCQLTNLVFGRFDNSHHSSKPTPTPSLSASSRRRRHLDTGADSSTLEAQELNLRERIFNTPLTPSRCRRHRQQVCQLCRSPDTKVTSGDDKHGSAGWRQPASFVVTPPPGLMNAIPAFLRTSAMSLRRSLEEEGVESRHQRVMGGGMPPAWYDLFLDLLTQAAIESYLCDGKTGVEPIFEIFSWGDVEDEEEANYVDEEEAECEEEEEEDDEDEDDEFAVKAADYHLLFPKTRTMFLLSKTLREREKENGIAGKRGGRIMGDRRYRFRHIDSLFLTPKLFRMVENTLEDHFDQLAQKYPLEKFELNMREYINTVQKTMAAPLLCKYENFEPDAANPGASTSPSTPSTSSASSPPSYASPVSIPDARADFRSSTISPSLLKFPGDGALLMPEVPDSDDEYDDDKYDDQARRTALCLAFSSPPFQSTVQTTLASPLQLPTQRAPPPPMRKRTREEDKESDEDEDEEDDLSDDLEQDVHEVADPYSAKRSRRC
ncbi:hypothetical protein BC938DRAFT_478699 [Jimgerdemannia flammicorona]|uniref:Uncharacterized protein n=1 Tax=Jimgerdemannia flammicorona TaxID=994334 RepID=A0A433QMH2_9FUNG|nr:hypothetical protein BC938DRAFT_478699 [Jimgerdemannia flammicorona]